jgi:hypothetical protein
MSETPKMRQQSICNPSSGCNAGCIGAYKKPLLCKLKTDLHRQKLRLLVLRLLQNDVHSLPCILMRLQLLQHRLCCRPLHTNA